MVIRLFQLALILVLLASLSCKKRMLPLANEGEAKQGQPAYSHEVKIHKEMKEDK